jgi:hypothetical protein
MFAIGSCSKVVTNVFFYFLLKKKVVCRVPHFQESKINMKERLFSVSVQCAWVGYDPEPGRQPNPRLLVINTPGKKRS